MIHGIGTDLAAIDRFAEAIDRHGDRFVRRLLGEVEFLEYRQAAYPSRFLAKRFAAKEAFGKALGTGIRAPATLHAIRVEHDHLGRPLLAYSGALAEYLDRHGLTAHLSISDEATHALAFVVIERREN